MSAADDCRRLLADEGHFLDEARQAPDGIRAALRRRDGLAEALRLQEALARAAAERGERRTAWREGLARRAGLPPRW